MADNPNLGVNSGGGGRGGRGGRGGGRGGRGGGRGRGGGGSGRQDGSRREGTGNVGGGDNRNENNGGRRGGGGDRGGWGGRKDGFSGGHGRPDWGFGHPPPPAYGYAPVPYGYPLPSAFALPAYTYQYGFLPVPAHGYNGAGRKAEDENKGDSAKKTKLDLKDYYPPSDYFDQIILPEREFCPRCGELKDYKTGQNLAARVAEAEAEIKRVQEEAQARVQRAEEAYRRLREDAAASIDTAFARGVASGLESALAQPETVAEFSRVMEIDDEEKLQAEVRRMEEEEEEWGDGDAPRAHESAQDQQALVRAISNDEDEIDYSDSPLEG